VWASIAAYRDGRGWLSDVISYLDGSRHLLAELLAEHLPGVGYQVPEGTYLAWLDCRGLEHSPAVPPASPHPDLAEFFLAKAGVLATDGARCGDAGRGYLRLNFATPRPILAEMIRRMGEGRGRQLQFGHVSRAAHPG
jgi:cystathionine beta-lyase